MSGFFDGVYGAKFPEVVMNSGPLPPTGGLPAPLHDTPDGKINYNSTLLGDLQPYAYGEGAYLSSQHSYLNIPHRIQKIIPVIYLPEPDGLNTFRLSHGIDDGDVAFSLRLNKSSLFCTGMKSASKRGGLGTAVDPLINLPTLNYILAGIQRWDPANDTNSLWKDFLYALDSNRFKPHPQRNYDHDPMSIHDIVHIVSCCIKPFGIMRGSEKQGGQNEMTQSPATWPVPFVGTLVIDGKEDHIVNMWHDLDVHSGEDLVLRLKPMPIRKYTLNHYYKQPVYKTYPQNEHNLVWQLVPDKMVYEKDMDMYEYLVDAPTYQMPSWYMFYYITAYNNRVKQIIPVTKLSWQELGYWHIGRTQIRIGKYNTEMNEKYYHNDMVNGLRSQYMMITFQPTFDELPYVFDYFKDYDEHLAVGGEIPESITVEKLDFNPKFKLHDICEDTHFETDWVIQPHAPVVQEEQASHENNMDITTEASLDAVPASGVEVVKKANPRRKKVVAGSVIRTDGSTEVQMIQSL